MITDQEAIAALARTDELHTGLTQIVLEGGDLDRICAEVARALGLDLICTSSDGRERAAHVSDRCRGLLAEADLVDPTGRIRVEHIERAGTPLGQGQARLLRVVAAGVDLARLVALRPTGTIDEVDLHSLERAATVAALIVTREEAVAAVENKYRGDFLRDVFLGRAGDSEYVAEHGRGFGWKLDRPVVVVVAALDPEGLAGEGIAGHTRRALQERFAIAWRQVARGLDPSIASVDFSSEIVTLLPVDVESSGLVGVDEVETAVAAVRGDKGGGRLSFSVGVSRRAAGLSGLPEAYQQARRAVEIGRRVRGSGSTTCFDQLGVHRLLALVNDPRELREFAVDVLGSLAENTPHAADLRETLRVLLDTNFNVAEAAREQFFHYNTMRYRVGKLERLLGPLASDPHLRLDVAVALRALEFGLDLQPDTHK